MGMAVWLVAWPTTKLALDRPPVAYDDFDDDDDVDIDETTDKNEPLEEQSR
jgi:hypothetical protein